MYALIDGQQLVLGPINFNHRLINSALEEEYGISLGLTPDDYKNVPIRVTKHVWVVNARQEYIEYDSRFEILTDPSYEIINNELIFRYSKLQKPLEQVKDEYKELIKPIRKQKENKIISLSISGNDIQISTDRDTRLALTTKLVSGDGPYNYKFDKNTWISLSKEDIQYIISEIDSVVQDAFDWELEKLNEVDTCTTNEEVYNVDISLHKENTNILL